MRRYTATAALAAALLAAGTAQAVNFGTGTYTENFNGLVATGTGTATTVPAGFSFSEVGSNADTSYAAGTGSSTAGDTYSFGSTGSSDRAFGTLQSGTNVPTLFAMFTNATGATVTALTIGYTGEQWRLGQSGRGADRLDFGYNLTGGTTYTDLDALDFNSPVTSGTVGALDGNAVANRSVLSTTLTGLSLVNGASIYFRWSDFNATGSDDGLGIDDFNLTPTLAATAPVPEPATWGMMLLGFGVLGAALRRRPRVATVAA